MVKQHPSVAKRERQNIEHRKRNKIIKSRVNTALRACMEALGSEDFDSCQSTLKQYYSVVDKAVKRGIYHRKKGANKKSRLTMRINKHFAGGDKAAKTATEE
jgi:small subunit ribosomal protein S20